MNDHLRDPADVRSDNRSRGCHGLECGVSQRLDVRRHGDDVEQWDQARGVGAKSEKSKSAGEIEIANTLLGFPPRASVLAQIVAEHDEETWRAALVQQTS